MDKDVKAGTYGHSRRAAQREADRREGLPVMAGHAELRDGLGMGGRAIALVAVPVIAREIAGQFAHEAVARDLGDDRGRRDGGAEPGRPR